MNDPKLHLVPPDHATTPTITASEELANELLELLSAFAARIPKLETPHKSKFRGVQSARTVSRKFIARMITAVNAREELQVIGTFDADEAHETLQFNDALRPVARRLAAVLASVNFTMASRKARVAAAALTTYAIAKGLARDLGGAALCNDLDDLRRDLGRRNGTKGPRKGTTKGEEEEP